MYIDPRSARNLKGVHPDLVRLVEEVNYELPMVIVEGVRDLETQRRYVKEGKSRTMNSRHLTGHAVDFAIFPQGTGPGKEPSWKFDLYKDAADSFFEAAEKLNIPITWGGSWKNPVDGMHIQLTWQDYPLVTEAAVPKQVTNSKTIAAAGGVGAVALAQQGLSILEGIDTTWSEYAALAVILVFVGFIVKERVMKVDREGV